MAYAREGIPAADKAAIIKTRDRDWVMVMRHQFRSYHFKSEDRVHCITACGAALWYVVWKTVSCRDEAAGLKPGAYTGAKKKGLEPFGYAQEKLYRALQTEQRTARLAVPQKARCRGQRPRRARENRVQEELMGHCGHLGLVRLQRSWPWRLRRR